MTRSKFETDISTNLAPYLYVPELCEAIIHLFFVEHDWDFCTLQKPHTVSKEAEALVVPIDSGRKSLTKMAVSEMNNDMTETVPLFINGKSRMSNKTFKVISPLTAQTVHHCAAASVADAKLAVDIAASAFDKWRRTTPSQRRDIFSAAAEIILSRSDEFKACMVKETGASDAWCDFNITTATDIIKDIAGRVATIEGSFPTLNDPNVSGIVMREAYGVVLAIAPWYGSLFTLARCSIYLRLTRSGTRH